MDNSELTIDYTTVITYAFTQYSLNLRMKELREKKDPAETEDMYQLHMRDSFCPESAEQATKE